MDPSENDELVRRGEEIYHERLRAVLEPHEMHRFVVIEPQSGGLFSRRHVERCRRKGTSSTPGASDVHDAGRP